MYLNMNAKADYKKVLLKEKYIKINKKNLQDFLLNKHPKNSFQHSHI